MNYKDKIKNVPNWPVNGVMFRDITPLLADWETLMMAMDDLSIIVDSTPANFIAGIESRGFIFGAGIASLNNMGFVPVRKAGKLPPPVVGIDSTKEYGHEYLEVKEGSGDIVIIDDVLATGGTLRATEQLLTEAGYNVLGAIVLIDLTYLHSEILIGGQPVQSLIKYDE
jgi:adenine phosphoribosyltransferase